MKQKITALMIFFLFTAAGPLIGLSIQQGRVKVVLHENSGRFSVYYLEDIQRDRYVSLLFERDPRTSESGLLMNNRILTLGKSSEFSQRIEKTVDGAKFVWTSPQLEVEQKFSFAKSDPNSLAEGIRIETKIKNISEQQQSVGFHLLLDTYLGEKGDVHFRTSNDEVLEREREFRLDMPLYWLSPTKDMSFEGLHSVLKGQGVTIPDRLVFSNWKRLSENLWNLQTQSRRNFNLLPYSINDSAVAQFYDPMRLPSGGQREITALMGAYNGSPLRITAGGTEGRGEEAAESRQDMEGLSMDDLRELAREDLIAVDDIIASIDSLLSFPENIEQDKIELIKRDLRRLDEKREQYTKIE
ncbi:MAG TPA: hypothetical protein ENN41_05010 [Sediminispirochaeta sp.]|nr:hypothetical protein [Sediminispirochaeta sp.]